MTEFHKPGARELVERGLTREMCFIATRVEAFAGLVAARLGLLFGVCLVFFFECTASCMRVAHLPHLSLYQY